MHRRQSRDPVQRPDSELTRRHRGVGLEKMVADLNPFVWGWAGYFGFSQWRELPSLEAGSGGRLGCIA
jgi:RNA-directed DNA polymerase